MAFWLTNAPDDYDYSYVKTVQELGTVTGERGKWRVIEDSDTEGRFAEYQLPRYQSGMHAVYPANGPDAKRMGVTISTRAGRSGVGGVAETRAMLQKVQRLVEPFNDPYQTLYTFVDSELKNRPRATAQSIATAWERSTGAGRSGVGVGGYERYTTDDDDDAGNYGYTKLNLSTGDERAYWFKTRAARDAAYTRGKAQPSQYGYGKPDRKILRRQALAVSRRGSDLDGVSGVGGVAGRRGSGLRGVAETDMDALIEERYELSANADSDGAFPGSKAWARANAAGKALEAFDVAHPEVLVEVRRRHSARVSPGSVWSGLGGRLGSASADTLSIEFSGAVSSRTTSDAEMRRTAEQAKNANYAATNAAMKIENKYGPSEKNGWKKQKMPPAEAAKLKKLLALQSAAMTVLKALPEKYRGDYGLRFF